MNESLIYCPKTIGIDEAGRGPLAGPVVAAAVWLPEGFDFAGINDSKKLKPSDRAELANRLTVVPHAIAVVEPEMIDKHNILQAAMMAMVNAYEMLIEANPECSGLGILVDGNRVPTPLQGKAGAMVKGDSKFVSIAAASILAKTTRDRIMAEHAATFPEYGFDVHFGYPTPAHLQALDRHGPCPIHRMTFSPIAARLGMRQRELAFE